MENKVNALTKVVEAFEQCANDNSVTGTEKRMNQNDRNKFKRLIKGSLLELFKVMFNESDCVDVFENEKGVAIRLDNESIGYITIAIDPMVKDLDYDAAFQEDDLIEARRLKAIEDERKAIAKERKIKADAELRAKKEELKRLKMEAREKVEKPTETSVYPRKIS
jgi:hypothetical protein